MVLEDNTVKSLQIKEFEVSLDVSDEEYEDDLFYSNHALSVISASLAEGQTPEVDAVSGATCSAKALIRFCNAARADYDLYLQQTETEQQIETADDTSADEDKVDREP